MKNIEVKDVGIVVGCDSEQEWMLEWWWDCYSKHNKLPVAFADYGMSKKSKKFCLDHGVLIDLTKPEIKTWFKKPLSIIKSPFLKTCMMDIDCQVRKPLDTIFNFLDKDHICVTKDPLNNFCRQFMVRPNQVPLATGVVVAYRNNELIQEWDYFCQNANQIRGDQEVFNYIISNRLVTNNTRTKIKILPDEYQWLRLYGDTNPNAFIMHWTGKDGKDIIKKNMKKN